MARMIFIALAFLISLGCLGMVWMAASAGDTRSVWLFAAFAFFFGLPALAVFTQFVRKRLGGHTGVPAKAQPSVRFVPHWQLITLIGIALLGIILAILISVIK